MAILTNETAQDYVTCIVGEWVSNFTLTDTKIGTDEDTIDVSFTYDTGHTGTMTVWIETNGELYGEW